MPANDSQLDLQSLAHDRQGASLTAHPQKTIWWVRYVIPVSLLLGFLGLLVWSTRDSFLPTQTITITPVLVSYEAVQPEGMSLFQAAGWIEPRPSPVVVTSFAAGMIAELFVVDGALVEQGAPIAKLVTADAQLALAQAQAKHTLQQAELQRAQANLEIAKTNLAKPVRSQALVADAGAALAQTQQNFSNLSYALKGALAKQALAKENVRLKELAHDAITGKVLREAHAALAAATNEVNNLVARAPLLQKQVESLQTKQAAVREQHALLTEEKQAVSQAQADIAVAAALLKQTQLAIESAQLLVTRMTVRAPITGRVLRVVAQPGQRLSGLNPHSEQGSSAVAILYDPANLQVRVDVRLEDMQHVQQGQPVRIESATLPQPLTGEVLSITSSADIQKNTLQVKVAITDPPTQIKPEMIAKVTFLALPSLAPERLSKSEPWRLMIPKSLVKQEGDIATVWVADLTSQLAHRKTVTLGSLASADQLVEITDGLQLTDKLIVEGRELLHEGARVHISHHEPWHSKSSSPSPNRTDLRTAQAGESL